MVGGQREEGDRDKGMRRWRGVGLHLSHYTCILQLLLVPS